VIKYRYKVWLRFRWLWMFANSSAVPDGLCSTLPRYPDNFRAGPFPCPLRLDSQDCYRFQGSPYFAAFSFWSDHGSVCFATHTFWNLRRFERGPITRYFAMG